MTERAEVPPRARRLYRLTAAAAVLVACYALAGFLAVPGVVRSQLERRLGEALKRTVVVREVAVNPFALTVTVRGLEVQNPGGAPPLVAVDEVLLDVQASSLWERGLVARELKIDRPRLTFRRTGENTYDFSDILAAWSGPAPASGPPSEPHRFSLANLQIVDGSLDFVDDLEGVRHEVRRLALALPFVSNFPHVIETFVTPSFSAEANGRRIEVRGRTKPFSPSRETVFDLRTTDLDLPFYLRYVPASLPVAVAAGRLDTELAITFSQPPGAAANVRVAGTLGLRGLSIDDRAGRDLASLDAAEVRIGAFDWPAATLKVDAVRLVRPDVRIALDEARQLDLGGPPTPGPLSAPTAASDGSGPSLATDVALLSVEDGRVRFSDRGVRPAFAAEVSQLALTLERFSTRKDAAARVSGHFATDAGEHATLTADFALDPWFADGTLSLSGATAARYAPYYASALNFDVDARGEVAARFRFADAARDGARRLGLELKGDGLRVRLRGAEQDSFTARAFGARSIDLDFAANTLAMEGLSADGGMLRVRFEPDGSLDLARLGGDPAPAGAGEASGAAPPADEPGLAWSLASLALRGYTLEFEDTQPQPPVAFSADRASLSIEGLSPQRGRKAKLSFRMHPADGDTVRGDGAFGLEPLSGQLALALRRLPLAPFEPYVADSFDAVIGGGALSGTLAVAWEPGTGDALRQTYRGDLTFSALQLSDRTSNDPLLEVGTLFLGGLDAGIEPFSFRAREIAVSDFYAHMVVDADATLNIARALRMTGGSGAPSADDESGEGPPGAEGTTTATPAPPAAAPASAPTTGEAAPAIAVDAITLQGGAIDFADRFVKPNFSARLTDVAGRLSGLSAIENRPADVALRATLGGYAPLEISGKLLPFGPRVLVDLGSRFTDVDLNPLTPYAGKYLGYEIQKGRLTWDLSYNVADRKLDAKHKVVLDQLELGAKVDSPSATSLPVRLAVALLKDREGRIDLEVPVSGSVDDPKFRVWPIIWKMLRNLLVKAATSPFALLGGGRRGGDDLRVLEFQPGQADLDGTQGERIATLAKLLGDRPSVRLEIGGAFDLDGDRNGLRRRAFERKVKAQKARDLARAGGAAPTAAAALDAVQVTPEEWPKYLAKAYRQEKFPKPRNALGIAKDLEPAEMEQLMLANIVVSDDDVRALASRRLEIVKEALVAAGVAAERLFLVDVKPIGPGEAGRKSSRVEFNLD